MNPATKLQYEFAIPAREEYVPRAALITPNTMILELIIICDRVAFFPMIFTKHNAGIITA